MLKVTGLLHVPEEAMFVQLLRDLALELDNGGGASDRRAYLSAQKDLRRILEGGQRRSPRRREPAASAAAPVAPAPPAAETTTTDDPTSDAPPPPNSLAEFKARRGIAT
ncbi:hypothetical protein CH252_19105 [Rhodococcus sp. 06-1477-1B]|nr:hypothetical protein CH252_19105 [Rhodococcus sp. 06-1477-1B]